MLYQFDTDNLDHAKAALLLYAMYRSRESTSPLNGKETWNRFNSFVRGACLKSSTTAEFVQQFCRKADVASIRPRYLSTDEPVPVDDGALVELPGVYNYRLGVFEDDSILPIIRNETIYLIMLVRERIQREKLTAQEGNDDED